MSNSKIRKYEEKTASNTKKTLKKKNNSKLRAEIPFSVDSIYKPVFCLLVKLLSVDPGRCGQTVLKLTVGPGADGVFCQTISQEKIWIMGYAENMFLSAENGQKTK